MISDREKDLVSAITRSFYARKLPAGRIIRPEFDLENHAEAARVDAYIRTATAIDRSNSAQAAFVYLNDEATIAILPLYLKSIILDYNPNDHLNYVVSEAISTPITESDAQIRFNIGPILFEIARDDEADTICSYAKWYFKKAIAGSEINKEIYGPSVTRAIELWCGRKVRSRL
ncbi:hypothetical protein OGR47_08680 [Methylocystis sp. MJC1]|uniref:hypothetical protein n=1 Tax=Methylocystis sp. MJC1 TaxID=2654282 RepID=UPI0013EBD363|nr:hypothetical protein [Methylocystis sp. MJC1]MBU6527061.1 hypothetical protein [Methylocystis sp. MJC1]UZX13498.1 hypothetical protein OGR47_08680 [Methylocystis sp. MJC1]